MQWCTLSTPNKNETFNLWNDTSFEFVAPIKHTHVYVVYVEYLIVILGSVFIFLTLKFFYFLSIKNVKNIF